MIQNWPVVELVESKPEDFIFEKDGVPSHCKWTVRANLIENLPERLIRHGGEGDSSLVISSVHLRYLLMGIYEGSDLCPHYSY